ncbi:MAG: hypothetical protein M3Z01_08140 [Thermoproteota archaeon]|nr:hypothetical protein [Thermoproteota archaeon]
MYVVHYDKIKLELEDNITGWHFRQVMDIIQKSSSRCQVPSGKYSSIIAWGYKLKIPQKRFVGTPHLKREKVYKKSTKGPDFAKNIWNILVKDESIFIHDLLRIKKIIWIIKEKSQ